MSLPLSGFLSSGLERLRSTRSYGCALATHITPETEGPSGCLRTLRLRRPVRSAPLALKVRQWRGPQCDILTDRRLRCSHDTSHARIAPVRERSCSRIGRDTELAARDYVSRAGKSPAGFRKSVRGKNRTRVDLRGFRIKSDARSQCATVRPRNPPWNPRVRLPRTVG